MKLIKLLLTENVDNLGIVGDVVSVRPGYARNFLLPRTLATRPTQGAIKRLATRRAQVELELKAHRAQMEALIQKLQGVELTLQRSANEQGVIFGGVSQHDISQALRAEGHPVDDRAVRIGQQIKRLDTYTIPIVLAADLKTEIKLWVVSDKPAEQLETGAPAIRAAQPPAETAGGAAATPDAKPHGYRRSKQAAESAAVAETAPAGESEKPKRKAKKAAEPKAAESDKA